MRYAFYEQAGSAREVLKIGDGPVPVPGPGDVLVRIKVSGVNPSDVKSRSRGSDDLQPFVIPHSDGAGIVEAVGPGVDRARVGERVWLWNAQWKRRHGTAAEYVALPSGQAVRLPDNVSFEAGASLGVPWLTAWRAVHYREIAREGETMLVAGGAGAVGHYAIQLAKRAGFRVLTTVSSAEKAAVARAAGADAVIDYRKDDVASSIADLTGGRGVDRIVEVDLAGNAPNYATLLRRNGFVVAYGSSDWSAPLPLWDWLFHGVELAVFIVYELASDVRDRAIEESYAIIADANFRHLLGARFPLTKIVEAHEAVESGAVVGNVVVEVP